MLFSGREMVEHLLGGFGVIMDAKGKMVVPLRMPAVSMQKDPTPAFVQKGFFILPFGTMSEML